MRKPKLWYCEIYKIRYEFCVGWTAQQFHKFYTKELNGQIPLEQLEQTSGRCVEYQNPDGIAIWVDENDKKYHHRTLMHECIHAAAFTLNSRGVGIDWPICEPLTYLAENIFYKAMGGR